jgi:hypothetical protein
MGPTAYRKAEIYSAGLSMRQKADVRLRVQATPKESRGTIATTESEVKSAFRVN